MNVKTKVRLMIALLSSLFVCGSLFADTEVSGFINNENWGPDGSPYIVTGNITIASLLIEPGVEIKFHQNVKI